MQSGILVGYRSLQFGFVVFQVGNGMAQRLDFDFQRFDLIGQGGQLGVLLVQLFLQLGDQGLQGVDLHIGRL